MRLVATLLLLCLPLSTFAAAPEPRDKYLARCHATPAVTPAAMAKELDSLKPKVKFRSVSQDDYPGRAAIVKSNKLALPAGKSAYPDGQLLYISGRVLDENCAPVSDAVIDIWQSDPTGKFVTSTLADRLSPYPQFTGTGRAVTDNLGRFNFVTLFPGPYDVTLPARPHHPPPPAIFRAPHINLRVIHKDFTTLETELFFADDRRNAADPLFSNLGPERSSLVTAKVWQRDDASQGLAGEWDITLRGVNAYRHF